MSPEFDRSFGIIEPEQMEIVKSEYGNRYVSITLEDILALITGKVLLEIQMSGNPLVTTVRRRRNGK